MSKDAELSRQLKVMMDKAKDSLAVAKQLHNQNHYNDAASKAYYGSLSFASGNSINQGADFLQAFRCSEYF